MCGETQKPLVLHLQSVRARRTAVARPWVFSCCVLACLALLSEGCKPKSESADSTGTGSSKAAASASGKATAAGAKLIGRREAKVNAVWVRTGPPPSGGTSEVTLRVEPSANHEVSVGIMEEFAGGTGDQWRAAAWLAAINASQTLGLSLPDYEFYARVGGHIDGPSAGMLMAATFAAILNGDTNRPDTTMTGTINPDGTAGPVGGIAQKLRGAHEKGLKRFGFPLGTRICQDLSTGQDVDLIELGGNLGMEMREIHDIWEAYEFLTGKKIPREEPVSETMMQLSPDLHTALRAKILNWKGQVESEMPVVERRYHDLQPEIKRLGYKGEGDQLDAQINRYLIQADTLIKNGNAWGKDNPGAYIYYVQGAVALKLLSQWMDFLKPAMEQDIEGMLNSVQATMGVRKRVESLAMEMKLQSRRNSIGGRVTAISGMARYGEALALVNIASEDLQRAQALLEKAKRNEVSLRDPQVFAELLNDLNKPLLYDSLADQLVNYAREVVSFGAEEGPAVSEELTDAESLGRAYASAAGAGLAYFDALVTSPRATAAGVSKEAAAQALNQEDFGLPIARFLALHSEAARNLFPDDPTQRKLVELAFGASAYLQGAALVNKYYSLQCAPDGAGGFDLRNREALSYQIDIARQRAREAAARCHHRLGFIPAAALVSYQAGAAQSLGRTDGEKINGLSCYWASTFWSDLSVQFVKKPAK